MKTTYGGTLFSPSLAQASTHLGVILSARLGNWGRNNQILPTHVESPIGQLIACLAALPVTGRLRDLHPRCQDFRIARLIVP